MPSEAGREGTPIRLGEGFPTAWGVGLEREKSLQSGLWGSVRPKDIKAALKNFRPQYNGQTWPVKRQLISALNFGSQRQN